MKGTWSGDCLPLTLRLWTFNFKFYLHTMLAEHNVPFGMNFSRSSDSTWARLRYWLFPLLTFNFAFLISACGLDVEDPTPPSPPVWVQKSLPEEWPEQGIDAHESDGIYLEWEPNPDEDITAYRIHRATLYAINDSLGDYGLLTTLELESTPRLEYIKSA